MSDKELLLAIARKDEQAFNLFYERHSRNLVRFALKCTRDEDFANEITQIFWIRVWEKPAEIKTDENDSANRFLSKFFTFRMLDIIKEKAEKKEFYCEYIEDFDIQSYNISDEMDIRELYAVIDQALSNLSETAKDIFKLLFIDELSTSQAAEYLKMNERTVLYKSQECIRSIRKSLEACYTPKKPERSKDNNQNLKDFMRKASLLAVLHSHFYF